MEKTVLNSVRVVLTGAAVLISMTATTAHAANGLKAKYENLGCKEYLNSSQSSDSLTSKCVSLGGRIDAIETRISKIYSRKNNILDVLWSPNSDPIQDNFDELEEKIVKLDALLEKLEAKL